MTALREELYHFLLVVTPCTRFRVDGEWSASAYSIKKFENGSPYRGYMADFPFFSSTLVIFPSKFFLEQDGPCGRGLVYVD